MNFGQIRTLVQNWLDDPLGGYFTPTVVDPWINNALIEVQKQLLDCGELWYLKCATTYLVQDVNSYSLPSDFLKANRFELRLQGTTAPNEIWSTLFFMTLNELANLNYQTAQPQAYTIGKDCLILAQIPDNNYQVKLHYSYKVAPLVNDLNVPDVPLQYHEYIAVVATLDGYLKDQRDPSIMMNKRNYYLELMKKDQIQRNRSRPRSVVSVMDDDSCVGY